MKNKEIVHRAKAGLVYSVLREKCPHCGKGDVFHKKSPLFSIPQMHERCEACDYRFDREPGYFIGAMYVSYGLAVAQGIAVFLLCHFFFPSIDTIWIPVLVMSVILLASKKNFRLSRVIYIHLFPW